MVNTGMPSGGCKPCRARRIKCDETKPACLKCQSAKRQCSGYRDLFDRKLRDETQATIRKYKRTRIVIEKEELLREESSRCETDDVLADVDEEDVKANVEEWTSGHFRRGKHAKSNLPLSNSTKPGNNTYGSLCSMLTTPLEEQAACYLLADYVLIADGPNPRRGHYKFVYKLLTQSNNPPKSLALSFKALSLVSLSSRPAASHLAVEAEAYYAKALREVNHAIQDPSQVKKDTTLAAVLLLAFYETLASTRQHLDEYVAHVKGAAHLIKMRGTNSVVDTDEGAEMFSVTRNSIIAMRSISPSDDREDYSWLLSEYCPDAYVSRVATLSIACAEIRMKLDAAIRGTQRDPGKVQTILGLLRKAQAISSKLSNLDQPKTAVWRLDREEVMRDGKQTPGHTYSFHNLYVCGIYCIVWMSLLFLNTCIFRCMAWLVSPDDWKSGEEYEAAVQVTKRCIGDIVAAMPYICTWNGYNSKESDFAVGATSADSPIKGVAGLRGFRPAYTAMMSDYATPEQKAYLQGRLQFLADSVGIKQVNALLNLQEETAHPSKDIERDRARI